MPVLVDEKELYQRFAAYGDEELLRILTVERAKHHGDVLAAAEKVLVQRGVIRPATPAPSGSHDQRRGQPKSPYQLIDFFVDALLFSLLYLATMKMDVGSVLPESWLADAAVRLLFVSLLTVGVMYLRHVWRTKEW